MVYDFSSVVCPSFHKRHPDRSNTKTGLLHQLEVIRVWYKKLLLSFEHVRWFSKSQTLLINIPNQITIDFITLFCSCKSFKFVFSCSAAIYPFFAPFHEWLTSSNQELMKLSSVKSTILSRRPRVLVLFNNTSTTTTWLPLYFNCSLS